MPGRVSLNKPITFGTNGNIKEFEPFGFDLSEESKLSWTVEEMAGFSVTFEGLSPDARLAIRLSAMPNIVPGRVLSQQLFVYMNGLLIGFKILSGHEDIQFKVPRNAVLGWDNVVTFVVPTATSPKGLGVGNDVRRLGVAISNISFVSRK